MKKKKDTCSACHKVIEKDAKRVVKHLKGDIKGYKDEANEDRALIKKLTRGKKSSKKTALKLPKKPARKKK